MYALIFGCVLLGADPNPPASLSLTEFVDLSVKTLDELAETRSKFPQSAYGDSPDVDRSKPEEQYEYVGFIKRKLRSLLEQCDTPEKCQALSNLFADHLAASPTFRFYDYHLMWLGARLMKQHPPTDKRYLQVLVAKVDGRELQKLENEIVNLNSTIVIEHLGEHIDSPMRVPTLNFEINWEKWSEYSRWFAENRERLQFDAKAKRWRVGTAK
ncbi:MAG: hypothetical protein JNK76_17135 [Planctomycetales bacterium]|nr:hypothetical protein [Planctomycetales bacterium]MBN8625818.1 hypothetical protein [Planctomycetota bacterium]